MPVNLNVCGQVNKIFKETTARPYLFCLILSILVNRTQRGMLKCIIARVRTRSWVQNIQSRYPYRYTRLYREKGAKNFWGSGILRLYYIEPKVCTHTIYFTTHTVGLKNEKNIAFIINKSRLKLMFKKDEKLTNHKKMCYYFFFCIFQFY